MKKPSQYGNLSFTLDLQPASQQSRAEVKSQFQEKIRKITSQYGYLLSGDVSVLVEWSVSEQNRYETDRTPDVDNILKPLLDALVGITGLLIDDNQVQHVSCSWIDSYSSKEKLSISINHSPDEWLNKEGLFFVQLEGGLCIPVSRKMPVKAQMIVVEHFERVIHLRNEVMSKGIDYYEAQMLMPRQRVFHRTRLGAFEVVTIEEFKRKPN